MNILMYQRQFSLLAIGKAIPYKDNDFLQIRMIRSPYILLLHIVLNELYIIICDILSRDIEESCYILL